MLWSSACVFLSNSCLNFLSLCWWWNSQNFHDWYMGGSVPDGNINLIKRKITSKITGSVWRSLEECSESTAKWFFRVEHKNSFCLETYIDKEQNEDSRAHALEMKWIYLKKSCAVCFKVLKQQIWHNPAHDNGFF